MAWVLKLVMVLLEMVLQCHDVTVAVAAGGGGGVSGVAAL